MRAKLTLKSGKTEFIFLKQATVGSDPRCTIMIAGLSPQHARIRFSAEESGFVIEPLPGAGSVQVEGKTVQNLERLLSGQSIELGGVEMTFRLMSDSELEGRQSRPDKPAPEKPAVGKAAPQQTIPGDQKTIAPEAPSIAVHASKDAPPPDFSKGPRGADDTFVIKARSVPEEGFFLEVTEPTGQFIHRLSMGENIIGRAPECTIILRDPSISRRHAVIVLGDGRAMLKDLGSKNHTFVNRERIVGEVELRPEALIRFGLVEARFTKSVLMEAGV